MHFDLIAATTDKKFLEIAALFPLTIISLNEAKSLRIIEGTNDETIRKALENKQTDILLDPHQNRQKDFMHFRNSGLNQVLCTLAHQNNITIGITPRYAFTAKELGRIMQNIHLCRKYNAPVIFLTLAKSPYDLRNPQDTLSFLKTLGMTGSEAFKTITFLEAILKRKNIKYPHMPVPNI